MTLPYSNLSMSQVNTECYYAANRNTGLNDSRVRTLFGVASGSIGMSSGRGKQGPPNTSCTINFYWNGREVYLSMSNAAPYGYYGLVGYGDPCWGCTLFSAYDFGWMDYTGAKDFYFGPDGTTDPWWWPAPKTASFYLEIDTKFGFRDTIYLGTWTSS